MPDLPRWSSKGCRILLLGDSAHAMYPNAAQGFSLIIEDIAALEYLLELRKPIAFVASIWEQVRKPRVDRVKRYAFDNTQLFLGAVPRPANVKDGSRVKSSNSTVKSLKHVVGDPSAPFNTASFYKWCYDHDAVKAVCSPENGRALRLLTGNRSKTISTECPAPNFEYGIMEYLSYGRG